MRRYFEWGSDLNITQMCRFKKQQEAGDRMQRNYTKDPFRGWERLWRSCETARTAISEFLKPPKKELVVLSQGTMEGAMRVIDALSVDRKAGLSLRDTILTTDLEFPPIYRWLYPHFDLHIVKISACTTQEQVRRALIDAIEQCARDGRRVRLALLSHVTYCEGRRLDLEAIIPSIKKHAQGVIVIVDGAQAVGHVDVELSKIDADFYLGDLHKWVQGPNMTGFIGCGSIERVELLARHATHPMAFSRSFGIENALCSKFGPLPAQCNAIPAALRAFIAGDLVVDSFAMAQLLRDELRSCDTFSRSLKYLCDQQSATGIVALPLKQTQRGIRKRLFEGYRILVTEHWPQVHQSLSDYISTRGILRICCADNWNTRGDVKALVEALLKEFDQ